MKKATLMAMIATVITGKRAVGMLSLSGSKGGAEAYWRGMSPPSGSKRSRCQNGYVEGVTRSADPWRDTDVVDERAARFAQGTTGIVALLGVVFGWPLAWALMSAQLLIGVTLGRRFCLPCLAYFVLVQPRFGEGPLEDSRPPRLPNMT